MQRIRPSGSGVQCRATYTNADLTVEGFTSDRDLARSARERCAPADGEAFARTTADRPEERREATGCVVAAASQLVQVETLLSPPEVRTGGKKWSFTKETAFPAGVVCRHCHPTRSRSCSRRSMAGRHHETVAQQSADRAFPTDEVLGRHRRSVQMAATWSAQPSMRGARDCRSEESRHGAGACQPENFRTPGRHPVRKLRRRVHRHTRCGWWTGCTRCRTCHRPPIWLSRWRSGGSPPRTRLASAPPLMWAALPSIL